MKAVRIVWLCSFLQLLLLTAVSGHALDPGKRISQYQHKAWRVQDGVLPGIPRLISQTTDGYLQVGAEIGSFRFDGVRFVPLPSSITPNQVDNFGLLSAKSGGFWIGDSNGVSRVKGERVVARFPLQGTSRMIEDVDGSIWVSRYLPGPPICHVTDLSAHCLSEAEGIPFAAADSILLDGKGGLWVGTDTGLAHWKSGHSEMFEYKPLKSNAGQHSIMGLVQDSDGSLWVGIGQPGPGLGLEKFDGRKFRPFVTRDFDGTKVTVDYLLMDRDQNLWVATSDTGLYRIHGETVDHFGSADGLSSDAVHILLEDREGIIWVATSKGIDSFTARNVTSFTKAEGLSADAVSSVMVSRDGTVWLSNSGSLDYIRNGEVFSIRSGAGLPGFQVTSLLEDRAGQIWVGVDDGLFLYKDQHFQRLPEPNHRPLGMVTGITEDVDGNIWAECASNPRRLVRIRDFHIQEEFSSSQVPAGHALAADPKGGIWVSTIAGDLVRIQNGSAKVFPLKVTEPPRQIHAEPDGSVLVAAPNEGLLSFRMGNVQRLTKRNGLPCDGVFSFLQDDQKNWWLGAPCGYISIADSEMQRWRSQPDTVVRYRLLDTSDGARTAPTSFNPTTKSPDGKLWFAVDILQSIDPHRLLLNKLPPPVHVEQIIADRKAYEVDPDADSNVTLPPRVRDLQIDYTALSFVAPQKVRFRYSLEGRDKGWQEPGTRRQAFYSDLWPGHYRFRVIASNNDGVWNETGAVLNFTIAPAWYQTAWFFAFCAIALLLLLWTLYQFRLRQLKHQFSRTLEARVDERTRIARDLHDTLLQSFQGLTLLFRRALNLLPEHAPEAIQILSRALDGADQAIIEGRDAIHDLRSPTTSANALAEEITVLGEELAAEVTNQSGRGPVQFRAVVEGSAHVLRPNAYMDIFRIAREALRNAFSHSQGHLIETELAYTESLFRLRIRDDGKGIDPDERVEAERSGHWGLKGMRERAGRLGGELEVWSDPGAGTEIELRVPASIAYETVLSHKSRWRLPIKWLNHPKG